MDLTIVRSKWLHNEPYTDSRLHRSSDGKMCCLGFYSLACGNTVEEISNLSDPVEVDEWKGANTKEYIKVYGGLMATNDSANWDYEEITDEQREERIIELFKNLGVNVTFID